MLLHRFSRTGALIIASILASTSGVSLVAEPIHWRTGSVLTTRSELEALLDQLGALAERPDASHVLVQFESALAEESRLRLELAGLQLLDYVGSNAYFATVGPDGVDSGAFSQVPRLIYVSAIEPAWKLHPDLAAGTIPSWAEGNDNGDQPNVLAYVMFHRDVPLDPDALAVLDRHGAQIYSQLDTVNTVVVELPAAMVNEIAAEDAVQWVEPPLPPLVAINDITRQLTEAEVVQAPPYGLDGSGVTVLVFDGGNALVSHTDFGGRVNARDGGEISNHATHVACTVGGDGTLSGGLYRGMAPGVAIESYEFACCPAGFLFTDPGDIEVDYDEAINVFGADIANNSIGTNVCFNGFDCNWTGDYGITSRLIDSIVRGSLGTPFRIVWANGNERGCNRCRSEGVHTPEGYHSTAPPACAKNHITVGALEDDETMTSFSSWGPTDDGRLKPDICAPGSGVTSCSSSGGYDSLSGTSMASPAVTGISALLMQDYRAQFPGAEDPRNSTVKALLAHTALDLQNTGPDYQTGYGSVKIRKAIDFMRSDQGENFLEEELSQGMTVILFVRVNPGDSQLKVTLAWDDFPGTPNVVPSLINDLDLRISDPAGTQHFPWTLDPANPGVPAVRNQADHLNNIEQVVVDAPLVGLWLVEIVGFSVPEGPQSFSLCASPRLASDCDGDGVLDDEQILADPSLDCTGNGILDVCESDCDGDLTADSCEILAGSSTDCDENSVPDDCQATSDCNANGTFDPCDIDLGTSLDCNANDVPDECDLASGTSIDCQPNGIPDECESDCNENGIPDDCDILDGTSQDCEPNGIPDECAPDCNGNGTPDECDIAAGTSLDCQPNNVPDECEVVSNFSNASGPLAPIDAANPQSHTIVSPPPAFGDVTLTFTANADLNGGTEYIDVDINGTAIGRVFESGAAQCPLTPDTATLIVAAPLYNSAVGGGDAVLTMTASAEVTPGICSVPVITVAVDYEGGGQDCNNNGVPDECDITGGTSEDCAADGVPDECEPDCNINGVSDSCDITDGTSTDCDANGIPDDCEPDCNSNGVTDACDIAGGTSTDCNANGILDECDIANGTSQDCQPNGTPDECEVSVSELLVNGGFETGDFSGWSVINIGSGGIEIDDGSFDPPGPDGPLPPCDGSFASVTFQGGPGQHTLYQEVTIPANALSAILSWNDRIRNHASQFSDPNQEFRVEIRDTNNNPLSEVFSTNPGDPLLTDCTDRFADVSAFIGQTIRVAFTQEDSLFFFNAHVDNVSLSIPSSGGSEDCNQNGIPDECDIAGGASSDCNANSIPDTCEMPDCNENGIPDDCDIAAGTSHDCQSNGVPDECEDDCNGNGIADECDLADGTSTDCQPNGVLDECEAGALFSDASGMLTPIYFNSPQHHELILPPLAQDDVTLLFTASADLASTSEFIDVTINGTPVGRVFQSGANDCAATPNTAALVVDGSVFNAAVGGGNALITMTASSAVDFGVCSSPFITVDVEYSTGDDCNNNGVPDECDINDGTSIDCQPNGIPDECEGAASFTDASGQLSPIFFLNPQTYTVATPPLALGDVTLSFTASADLANSSEFIDVDINGTPIGSVFQVGAADCAGVPNTDSLVMTAAVFNAAVGGGHAVINMVATPPVDIGICPSSFITVTVTYAVPADCNGNGIPDECDIAGGASLDCQPNTIPDECEVDCNANGVPDDCDIANGTSLDCQLNGIPDECEGLDCNANGIPDECDILDGTSADCNRNQSPDECDVADGTSTDCQPNSIPDECELIGDFADGSVQLAPFDEFNPQTFTIVSPPVAVGDVTLTLTASADLDSSSEFVDVDINGTFIGTVFQTGAAQCPALPNIQLLTVPASIYNTVVGGGNAAITMSASSAVDPGVCGAPYIMVAVAYEATNAGAADCNNNGLPDDCDIRDGTSLDCQPNNIPDECELRGDFVDSSAELSPIYWASPQSHTIPSAPVAFGNITLLFTAIADLNGFSEAIDVDINGTSIGRIFESGTQCPFTADSDQLVVTAATFNAATGGGDAIISMAPDVSVDGLCSFSFITVTTSFEGPGNDCNTNGVPDTCDIAGGTSQDCNGNTVPDECEPDCNLNGIPDDCDIASGASLDCQLNGTPDECEIDLNSSAPGGPFFCANNCAADCNNNGVPDECDITGGSSPDCNGNGVPDECETDCNGNGIPDDCDLANGTSSDCQPNGIPDECEADCNSNDVPDDCDITDGTSPDCNGTGTPDECDLIDGTSEDCQPNGIPDECELSSDFSAESGQLAPFDDINPQSHVIGSPPPANGNVTLNFTASADLDATFEFAAVDINGTFIGTIFGVGAQQCPAAPSTAVLTVSASNYNTIVGGGDAVITMAPNFEVDASVCVASFITVAIEYVAPGPSGSDCNSNGVPDECDVDGGTSADCQGNGIPDECELGGDFTESSGQLSPIHVNSPQSYTFRSPPFAVNDATLSFAASADLNATSEFIDVEINGTDVGTIFVFGAQQCLITPSTAALTIPAATYNALVRGGDAKVNMWPSSTVGIPEGCFSPFITVALGYETQDGDCNGNGVPDECDVADGTSDDCNLNGIPDECDIDEGTSADCNNNGLPDECEIAITSTAPGGPFFCNVSCAADCNNNGVPDECDIANVASPDCNANGIPDECEIAENSTAPGGPFFCTVACAPDCNNTGVPDECDIADATSTDCNGNTVPDECDIADATSLDCQPNGIPDDCEPDADIDGVPDDCDNCVSTPNPGQTDTDGDGDGDACDTDDDNDCVADDDDVDPLVPTICEDLDGDGCDDCSIGIDGFGSACDNDPDADGPDEDADGVCDSGDLCPGGDDRVDTDGDGVPDFCDPCPIDNPDDTDGDGVCESDDQCHGVDDTVFAPTCVGAIPTVSTWGIVTLALLLMVIGKLRFGRQRCREQ